MDYRTVAGEARRTFEIKHSLFHAVVCGIETFEKGMSFVRAVAKNYSDATHNCYAVLLQDGTQKCSDDGEPQGTAGYPILEVLKKRELTGVAAVVTRYFGGIKLGTGGLVTSYQRAVSDALDAARIVWKKESTVGRITLSYSEFSALNSYIQGEEVIVLESQYGDFVELTIAIPIDKTERFCDRVQSLTAGQKQFVTTGYGHYIYQENEKKGELGQYEN